MSRMPGVESKHVVVCGAGLVGCLCALILAKRGYDVDCYERWPDMRAMDLPAGRSINLVLTARGLRALGIQGLEGLKQDLINMSVPVLGRMMHSVEGELTYTPYGNDGECNFSISREGLNKFLMTEAEKAGVRMHFGHRLMSADFNAGMLKFQTDNCDVTVNNAAHVIGCDGGGSGVRYAMREAGLATFTEDLLEHGYKELTFPAGPNNRFMMEKDALHIWPRGSHMLMGLADLEGSFTGTIYMAKTGPESFESLNTKESILAFFQKYYPDAIPLLGGADKVVEMWMTNTVGILGTVRTDNWAVGDKVLLLGDAAHAIVPFFGQGCNCGFEDCLYFDKFLREFDGDFAKVFEATFQARKKPADAIADMALENFIEMRDRVGDPKFILKKRVEALLAKKFPTSFRPRYPMVVYSSSPYNVVKKVGETVDAIVAELADRLERPEDVDLAHAEHLITTKLAPVLKEFKVDLTEDWHSLGMHPSTAH